MIRGPHQPTSQPLLPRQKGPFSLFGLCAVAGLDGCESRCGANEKFWIPEPFPELVHEFRRQVREIFLAQPTEEEAASDRLFQFPDIPAEQFVRKQSVVIRDQSDRFRPRVCRRDAVAVQYLIVLFQRGLDIDLLRMFHRLDQKHLHSTHPAFTIAQSVSGVVCPRKSSIASIVPQALHTMISA